jgi:hypothetical protein
MWRGQVIVVGLEGDASLRHRSALGAAKDRATDGVRTRLNGMTPLVAGRARCVDTRKPAICALCRRRVDWSGADHHRAPGSLEDGIVLCRDCFYRVEHGEAA